MRGLSNLLTLSVPDEGYSRKSSYLMKVIPGTCRMHKARYQGRIQDFKLGGEGAHLKKLRRAEGGAKMLGYFVWKITILPQKIIFFPILGGCAPDAPKETNNICLMTAILHYSTYILTLKVENCCTYWNVIKHLPTLRRIHVIKIKFYSKI
jgi:hypothetical protein